MGYNFKPKHPRYYAKKAYAMHKFSAKIRNIPFLLTFEEWDNWWLSHGIDKNIRTGGFSGNTLCMCRNGDVGPYSLDNIYCDTNGNNAKIAWINNVGSGLPKKPVKTPIGSFTSLSEAGRSLGVAESTIRYRIKAGKPGYCYL